MCMTVSLCSTARSFRPRSARTLRSRSRRSRCARRKRSRPSGVTPSGRRPAAGAPLNRPVFRSTDVAAQPPATEVEIIERLVGPVNFAAERRAGTDAHRRTDAPFQPEGARAAHARAMAGRSQRCRSQLTQSDSRSEAVSGSFQDQSGSSFEKSWTPPRLLEQKLDAIAEFSAPLTGSLRIFERQNSCRLWPHLARGQSVDTEPRLARHLSSDRRRRRRAGAVGRVSSRASPSRAAQARYGRSFTTSLSARRTPAPRLRSHGNSIVGTKTFTYERRCNPWRQLMEVTLETFPGQAAARQSAC